MTHDPAIVWVDTVNIECPFCEEDITNPQTGDEWWDHEDFRLVDTLPILHPPCGRMYEVPSPFTEPLS